MGDWVSKIPLSGDIFTKQTLWYVRFTIKLRNPVSGKDKHTSINMVGEDSNQ